MNKSMTLLTSALLVSVLALPLAFEANAGDSEAKAQKSEQRHGGEHKKHMKRKFKKMARYLQLSDEQKDKVKAIFEQAKEEKVAHRETLKDFREQVKSLMDSAVFDESAFTALHSQYQSQFAQAALLKAKTKHAMLQILTQEQREKLASMKGRGKGFFH